MVLKKISLPKMWAIVLATILCLSQVNCILSKNNGNPGKTTGKPDNIKKQDNVALPTLDRDFGE